MENPSEYFRGMSDCKDGNPHLINQHKDYDQGFSDQYHLEQTITGQQRERANERLRQASRNTKYA